MLEHSSLLLLPTPARGDRRAWIIDPHSTVPLGFACRKPRRGPLAWLCWWRRSYLAIHEIEDEPLLMTVQPRFGPWTSWLVCDADDHPVGYVNGKRLYDSDHQLLALLQPDMQAGVWRYRGADGVELAMTVREDEGVRLTFLKSQRSSPFVRMVLLAAALVHNQEALAGSPCSPASPSLPTRTS